MILIKCLKNFAGFSDVEKESKISWREKKAETATTKEAERLSNDILSAFPLSYPGWGFFSIIIEALPLS